MTQPFIETVSRLNLTDRLMTPFFRVTDHIPKKRKVFEFLSPFLAAGVPVSGQIMGVDRNNLCITAKMMLEAGCFEVNFNCGCPSARVVSGNAGGGCLKNLSALADILKDLRNTLPAGCFSIKSRIGFDNLSYEKIMFTLLENGMPDRLFIHARTVKEQYRKIDDIQSRFARIIELSSEISATGMHLILNGDIDSAEKASKLAPHGVMCARSWMRDPGLLRRIECKAVPEPEEIRRLFFETFMSLNNSRGAALEISRMLWGPESSEFRSMLSN